MRKNSGSARENQLWQLIKSHHLGRPMDSSLNRIRGTQEKTYRQWYIRSKLREIMNVQGDRGITIKTVLLAGLREDELCYCYNQEICNQNLCGCSNLHVTSKSNGISIVVVNWIRKSAVILRYCQADCGTGLELLIPLAIVTLRHVKKFLKVWMTIPGHQGN